MSESCFTPNKNNRQSLWAGALLALLTLSCYTVVFFSLDTDQNTFLLHRDLYLISIAFLLIMMLIVFITKRKNSRNEQTLQATQKEYLNLLQYAADPVVILNELGIIISANSSVETISGYSPKELIGRHFLKINILQGTGLAIAAREFLQLIRGAKRPPFELAMIRKDNVPFITEAHASKIKDINGKPVIHVIMRDITERKKTEEKLLNEKTKAQNYLNIADVIITTFDQNANVTLINKKGCEILEYSEEEIIGQNWFEKFLLPESSLPLKHIFNQLMQGEKILLQNYENYVLTKTGKKRLILWSNTLIHNNKNEIIGTLSSGQDITEERNIKNQLMLHSAALEAAANAIVITDKQGKIIWTNQSLTDITGYAREEAIGQNPQILKSGLHNEHFYANLWDTILAGKIWHGEIINRRKDTRLYTEEMTITPVRNSTGEIEHFVAIKRDITERKRLQQNIEQMNLELAANTHKLEHTLLEMASKNKQLQEAQNQLIQSEKLAAIGVLSSGIAHEIKNPLAIISLSIEEFESLSDKLDAQSKSYIQMIKSAAERANNVIIELLRFARVSDLKSEYINLFSLVEGTFVLLNNSSKFKGITLEHKYTNTDISINGDRILLEQVLFNLLINAVDESSHGATVTVKTSLAENFKSTHKKKQVLIEVIDTGKGIDPEILPKIFEPFFTTKEQGKGTGLGLSTVYTLLKRHNGTIDVESTVGKGTKFTITLPCAEENPNITNGG